MLDIKKLKKLREESGVSFALCKKALEESNNNIEKAKKILHKLGAQKMKDKLAKATSFGAIFSYVHHNKKVASLVEVLCESDSVAANAQFQNLGVELAMQVASMPAQNLDELMQQEYIRDPSIKVADLVKEAVIKFGENIKIAKFVRWTL